MLGSFLFYTVYSKRKDKVENAWRFPFTFIWGNIIAIIGVFLLATMFINSKYAAIITTSLGLLQVFYALVFIRLKQDINWLMPLSLIGGVVAFIFGVTAIVIGL